MIVRLVALLVVVLVSSAVAAPLKISGFPLKVEGAIRSAPAIVDVDADGLPDLVVEHAGKLSVYSSEGKLRAGFPVDLAALAGHAGSVAGLVSAGDLDGDGKAEIAAAMSFGETADGVVVVVRADGTSFWATPLPVPKGPGVGPTMADVNGDGRVDLLVGARDGQLHAVDAKAASLPGFPVKLGSAVTSPIAFGSLVRGGKPVVAAGTADGKLHALLPDGQSAKGFPIATRFAISGAPAFADIDNDGEHELVFASQDYSVYAVNADGTRLPGYPVKAAYRIYGGPALGDLDRDGQLDVVVGAGDGKIYAWTATGQLLKGFPVSAGGRLYSSVIVVDGNRDGADEIYASAGDGNLYGFQANGKAIAGFPVRVGGDLVASPTAGDFVPDASVELLVGGPTGDLQGFRLQRTGELPQGPLSWPAQAHDSSRQGHFGPNPARYRKLALTPAAPVFGQALQLSYEFYDLDGDPEPKTRISWTRDNQPVPELDGAREVPGALLRKGQQWRAQVQAPEDFALFQTGPGSHVVSSPVTKVADTAPGAPKVMIQAATARVTEALTVVVETPATDPDGDAITYKYRWFRDGDPAGEGAVLPVGKAKKNERWRVLVTPNDGELDGAPTEAEIVIRNSVPSLPQVALEPATPTTESEVTVRLVKPAVDPDGDPVSHRFAYAVNGAHRSLPPELAVFPKGVARRNDALAVDVWASDGEEEGPRAHAELKVANASPIAPKVVIAPAAPTVLEALSVGIAVAASDPDADPLEYRIRWLRDGSVIPGERFELPSSELRKGQRWVAELAAFDGGLTGPVGRAEVVIGNAKPGRPRIGAALTAPVAGETVAVSILAPAVDPDGDALRYEYLWSVDGKPATIPKERASLQSADFRKGQKWRVEVTAIDTDGARGPSAVLELRPRNAAPTAPAIAIEPLQPNGQSALKAIVQTPASDPDRDAVTYRYRWFRDGAPAIDAGEGAELKAGLARRGEEWRVVATPHDGELEGPAAEARVLIGNLPPSAPQLALEPSKPTVASGLACRIAQPAVDPDGDALSVEYRWKLNGKPFPLGLDAAAVPASALRSGQAWTCEVVARDRFSTGPVASGQATIVNTAPTAPTAVVDPKASKAGDALTCAVVHEGIDVDGDRVAYEFKWIAPAGVTLPALEDPARIPPGLVRKGQGWKCEATATDGSLRASALSPVVTVGNTLPRAPRVKVAPSDPPAGGELRCELTDPAVDPDGDKLSYAFTWFRNGERQPFADTSAAVPGRLVKTGEKWRCAAVASDAGGAGLGAKSGEVVVRAATSAGNPSAGK